MPYSYPIDSVGETIELPDELLCWPPAAAAYGAVRGETVDE